jgi:phosphoribosylformylglycinamidine synthase
MWKAEVQVTLKDVVFDPQGNAVERQLDELGYKGVQKVRIGKYIEVLFDVKTRAEAESQLDEICKRVLVNQVLEHYSYQLVEVL